MTPLFTSLGWHPSLDNNTLIKARQRLDPAITNQFYLRALWGNIGILLIIITPGYCPFMMLLTLPWSGHIFTVFIDKQPWIELFTDFIFNRNRHGYETWDSLQMSCHLQPCPPSSSDIPQSALDKFLFNWLQKATMWNCTPVIIHVRGEMSLRRYLMRRSKSKIKILKGSLKSFLVSRVIQSAQRYLVTWRLNTLLLSDTRSCFLEAWFRPSKQFINILNDMVSKAPPFSDI